MYSPPQLMLGQIIHKIIEEKTTTRKDKWGAQPSQENTYANGRTHTLPHNNDVQKRTSYTRITPY